MSCYFPWCGVEGRLCVECAQDARRAAIEAAAPRAVPHIPSAPTDEWDRMCGAAAFHEGEGYDFLETPAWRTGFEDEVGFELADDYEDEGA